VPGEQVACPCLGGGSGVQVCAPDGKSYGACLGCGSAPDAGDDAGYSCPPGLQCDVASDSAATTISGKVYDPAGRDPLYNAVVYVPLHPLTPLPKGIPTGADACSCDSLFTSGAVAFTTTSTDGSFTLTDVPVGANVPLVVQIGKWRRVVHVPVTACQDNPIADKSLTLPSTIPAGDTDDNMPDIAVSTGGADTLECVLARMGISPSEYVAGAGTTGHVHVFAGGNPAPGGTGVGTPENPGMTGAPASHTSLWASQAQLMPYDLVMLSCEGGETYDANPPALEAYLNAGGRAFATHFHYAWFAGPLSTTQSYTAPSDWGPNLAAWSADTANANGPIGGQLVSTLNGTSSPFARGLAFQSWLKGVGALGQAGVPAGELSIYQPRYNANVTATNKASQPWITADPSSGATSPTMYFTFDTPVNATDASTPQYCGRAAFSDVHVAGDPSTTDTSSPPSGCAQTALSPQERALEFLLFDLTNCLVLPPSPPGPIPPPPPKP
jgi:hypothetical protein